MKLERIVKKTAGGIKNFRSPLKRTLDRGLDTILTVAGLNVLGLYALGKTMNYIGSADLSTEGGIMFMTYMGWGGLTLAANAVGIPKVTKFWNNYHKKKQKARKPASLLSFGKTLAATTIIAATVLSPTFNTNIAYMKKDWRRGMAGFTRQEERTLQDVEDAIQKDITPNALEALIPQYLKGIDILETNRTTTHGRFLRTLRWDKIISDAEARYGIPDGLMAGLAMRESYGNPTELNSGSDGGAGLYMFQPGTAQEMGMSTYGKSTAQGRDTNHGRNLIELCRSLNWDYTQLAATDERFDVEKASDAAARYLVKWKQRFGSWDKALSAYNRGPGRVASTPRNTQHVKMTRIYQRYYLDKKQELGQDIDQELLAQLEAENGFNFEYVRKNSEGDDVFVYNVSSGDNATVIADNFNRWDQKRGDKYQTTKYQDIVDKNRNFIGHQLQPKQKVYVLARSKI